MIMLGMLLLKMILEFDTNPDVILITIMMPTVMTMVLRVITSRLPSVNEPAVGYL